MLSPKKLIFLGTPAVAALVLKELLMKARHSLQVILVVSQPPSPSTRGHALTPSPVHALALEEGIPVLTPENAKDPEFLETLRALEPDLCLTAAYGQILSDDFLKIPKLGTVNIHPSLLPSFRGAAPVQRTLEAGLTETGVSVLFTVKAMDAGPIIVQEKIPLDDHITAPLLLEKLFILGTRAFIKSLSRLFHNELHLITQDESKVTKAKKIAVEESMITKSNLTHLSAKRLHDKLRAFTPWPGLKLEMKINEEPLLLKVHATQVVSKSELSNISFAPSLFFYGKRFFLNVQDTDETVLELLKVQLPGKKVIDAPDFKNALQNKSYSL
jgi:methionyl-tRNA formyltransferase